MKGIRLDTLRLDLPECWADVPAERLPELLRLVYFGNDTGADYLEVLKLALNVRSKDWLRLIQRHFSPEVGKKSRKANAIVLHDLYRSLTWMQTEPLTRRPFHSLTVEGVTLLLPKELFAASNYGEITDAYIHFLAYIRQLIPGNDQLNLLIATLCRPARDPAEREASDWNGDPRERYNEFKTSDRAELVKRLSEGQKMAVLLYFAGSMKALLERYSVFGGGGDEPENYPGQGMVKNGHLLAEKGVFGTFQETKSANVHDVLLFLEEHRNDILAENDRKRAANDSN